MEDSVKLCDGCGVCVALCPMQDFYNAFSVQNTPRALIRRMRLGEPPEKMKGFSFCLDCSVCEDACPQGVRFREVLKEVPLEVVVCVNCGVDIRTAELLERIEELTSREIVLCSRCEARITAERLRCSFPSPGKNVAR